MDYWDDLGWADPFSSEEFTERQRAYARAFGEDTVYTPQMVVQGRTGFTGSDLARARKEVRRLAGESPGADIVIAPGRSDESRIRLKISAVPAPGSGVLRLYCAVFENGLSTDVRRGENRGATLAGDFVVRSLSELASLKPGEKFDREVELDWKRDWDRRKSGVAVFLQDDSRAVRSPVSLRTVSPRRSKPFFGPEDEPQQKF